MTPAVAMPFTTDASALYAERLRTTKPDDHMVLPEIISKEPLGPAVPPWRRSVVRRHEVDALRDAQC